KSVDAARTWSEITLTAGKAAVTTGVVPISTLLRHHQVARATRNRHRSIRSPASTAARSPRWYPSRRNDRTGSLNTPHRTQAGVRRDAYPRNRRRNSKAFGPPCPRRADRHDLDRNREMGTCVPRKAKRPPRALRHEGRTRITRRAEFNSIFTVYGGGGTGRTATGPGRLSQFEATTLIPTLSRACRLIRFAQRPQAKPALGAEAHVRFRPRHRTPRHAFFQMGPHRASFGHQVRRRYPDVGGGHGFRRAARRHGSALWRTAVRSPRLLRRYGKLGGRTGRLDGAPPWRENRSGLGESDARDRFRAGSDPSGGQCAG